jgi:hypothetical protein
LDFLKFLVFLFFANHTHFFAAPPISAQSQYSRTNGRLALCIVGGQCVIVALYCYENELGMLILIFFFLKIEICYFTDLD